VLWPVGEAKRVAELGPVRLKVAVTDLISDINTLQDPVPVQAPDQPTKVDPGEAAAKMTVITLSKYDSEQSPKHEPDPVYTPLMPGPVTFPAPVPEVVTVSEYEGVDDGTT
jgi:hypothetical protein